MQLQELESAPEIQNARLEYEAANVPFEPALQDAYVKVLPGLSDADKSLIIARVVKILAAELKRCIGRRLTEKANTPAKSNGGAIWRLFYFLFGGKATKQNQP